MSNSSWKYNGKPDDLADYLKKIYDKSCNFDNSFINEIACVAKAFDEDTELLSLLESDSISIQSRLMSFYALCIKYRRFRDYTKFKDLLFKYNNLFEKEPLYKFQRMVYLKSTYEEMEDLELAISIWNGIPEDYKNIPGFVQAYGDSVALLFENNYFDITNESQNIIRKDAIQKMANAIHMKDYAKFYSTLGRLYAAGEEYEKGINYIRMAIDKEDSADKDYSLRINDYQSQIIQIKVQKLYKNELDKINIQKQELQDIKTSVEKSKYDSLAFLGFFTALISFTFGTFSIASGTIFSERVRLILILCGSLIIAFASLRLILNTFKGYIKDTIFMFIIGTFIILFSLLIVPLLA